MGCFLTPRALLLGLLAWLPCFGTLAEIRDGGVDPANLGQGGWLYLLNNATNHLAPNRVTAVTNEDSLFKYLRSQGLRYVIVKAGTADAPYYDNTYSRSTPVFTSNLVNLAHANGLKVFGSNRSSGSNIVGEISVADYVFKQGADGFIWDAEAEWEASPSRPWITNGPAQAWWLCSTVRSNWPTKFLAHNPFDTLYLHSSFPYKEFGYWSDCVMPQVYHHAASQGNAFAAIHWTDVNYKLFQDSLARMAPSNINGQTIYWTNAIKPLCLMRDVYGANHTAPMPPQDVMNFLDYLAADPNCVTPGGYQGSDYFRTELYDATQWAYIKSATVGQFADTVNRIILDDASAAMSAGWTLVRTISATTGTVNFSGATGGDTNSFGTNYFCKPQGNGGAYVQFTPNIVIPGDYEVFQWHPTRADASTRTPHIISCCGGTTIVYANQQTNAGNWSLLGRFNFAAGTGGNIRVTDAIPESGGVAIADGLKLVYVTPTVPPTAPGQAQATPLDTGTIDVAWANTATNAAGFIIARSTAQSGPFADVASLGPAITSFRDRGLFADTTYYYLIRATNFAGASSSLGPVSATTLSLGPVRMWGDSSWGQAALSVPASNVIAIALGGWHSLALRTNGTLLAWGNNSYGQCDAPATLTNALAIAAGTYHSLAIRADGTVAAWGSDDLGQTNVPGGLSQVIGVAGGRGHSLALRANGTVVAWGDSTYGQGSVPVGLRNVVSVAAAGNHSLALRADGTVVGWGDNTDAYGAYSGQSVPPRGLSNVVAIAAGDFHSLAVLDNGRVVAWGDDSEGQCEVPADLTNAVAVAGGRLHTLALRADGTVCAWGADYHGQCQVPLGTANVMGIGAGALHSLALVAGAEPVNLLLNPVRQGKRFTTLVQSLNRRHYVLECKDSLTTGSWTALSTNAGNGTLKQLSDTNAPGAQRFYRLRQW
jgi:hypothetical protein